MLPMNKEGNMRYLALGFVVGALIAAPAAVLVDRSQSPDDGNDAVLVYVAREFIPKGTLVTRNDLYFVTPVPRRDVEDGAMPVIPWVGAVATRDIQPGDQHTAGDFKDQSRRRPRR
jgi:SAF domain-containing protein